MEERKLGMPHGRVARPAAWRRRRCLRCDRFVEVHRPVEEVVAVQRHDARLELSKCVCGLHDRRPDSAGLCGQRAVSGKILFGHAHAEFPGKAFADYPKVDIARGTINGVPAVMPGRWGDHLGVIDLTLDNASGSWKVVGSQATIRPIFDRTAKQSLAAEDPMVMQLIGAEHQRTLDYVRNKVAFSSAPIYSYFALVEDDPSVQIVSNAQIAYVKRALTGTPHEKLPVLSAAAPFKSGGRQGWNYYTDIPAGPLAIKHVADLYISPTP